MLCPRYVFQEGVYPTRKVAETALQNEALYVYEENGDILGSIILNRQQPDEYKKIEWVSKASDEKVQVEFEVCLVCFMRRFDYGK